MFMAQLLLAFHRDKASMSIVLSIMSNQIFQEVCMKNFIDKIKEEKSNDLEKLNITKVKSDEDWTDVNLNAKETLAHAKVIKGLVSKKRKHI